MFQVSRVRETEDDSEDESDDDSEDESEDDSEDESEDDSEDGLAAMRSSINKFFL